MIIYIQTDTPGKLEPVNSNEVYEICDWGDGVCSIELTERRHMLVTDLEGDLIELGWKLAGREIDNDG